MHVLGWRRAPRGKGRREGQGRNWSQLELSFVLICQGSLEHELHHKVGYTYKAGFVPLLVSHGPPWEVSGQASCSHWAGKLDPLPARGWGSSQVSTTVHMYTSKRVFIPTYAHIHNHTQTDTCNRQNHTHTLTHTNPLHVQSITQWLEITWNILSWQVYTLGK